MSSAPKHGLRSIRFGLAAIILAAMLPGWSGVQAQEDTTTTVVVATDPAAGAWLTDPDGFTLYSWAGDDDGVSNCTDACAIAWPALLVTGNLIAPPNLPGSLGFIARDDDSWQVTFNNRPLYYFVRDTEPGDANGDGSMGFGARWSVVMVGAPPVVQVPPPPPPPVIQPPLPPAPPPPPPTARPTPVPPPPPPAPTAVPTPTQAPPPPPPPTGGQSGPSGPGGYSIEAPQFGSWGPGMNPPAAEGPGSIAPSMGGSSAAAPFYAVPPNGMAPVPYNGCQADLSGYWSIQGRQTVGGFAYYSASVNVRQYGIWVQAQQDDGTQYYGQCIGNQLQFDVYRGGRYIGRQSGTINGGYYITPMYDPALYPAPYVAPVPPYGGGSGQATFTWRTWYGQGTETWSRRYY